MRYTVILSLCLALASLIPATRPTFAQDEATKKPTPAKTAPEKPAADKPAADKPTADKPAREKPNIRFHFDGVPYPDVIRRFAQMANKPLVGEITVEGTVTFTDSRPYTYGEALDTLNVMLSMKGVVLVETDRFIRLAPRDKLQQLPLKIFRGIETTGDVRPGEVVTVVLPLAFVDATETAAAASKMLSDAGSISALVTGKGLIVTDRMAAIRRIQDLVVQVDIETTKKRQLMTVRLVNASGDVLAEILEKTFGAESAPREPKLIETSWKLAPANPETYITVSYDQPTGTLILFGPPTLLTLAQELIDRFEKEGESAGELRIFYPRVVDAAALAKMIRQGVSGVAAEGDPAAAISNKAKLIVDATTNRLIVTAPVSQLLRKVEEFIDGVDRNEDEKGSYGRTRSTEITVTRLLRVTHTDLDTASAVLKAAAGGRLSVHAHSGSSSLVVSGSPASF